MADALKELADWAQPLLHKLQPQQRRAAMREVAQYLQRSQVQRIASQRNPDGTPYVPRRPRAQLASKTGAIRKQMFMGLRKLRYLPRRATADLASVGINPRVAYVARVHHLGLRDRVDRSDPTSPEVQYPRRELLGFTDTDLQAVEDILLQHLMDG
jgi:phage virion morphogenesis protein